MAAINPLGPVTSPFATIKTWGETTVKLCIDAAALPGWLAAMVQVPVFRTVTLEPETVHTEFVVDEKLMGGPENAVANNENGSETKARFGSVLNVIVGFWLVTWKLCAAKAGA